MDNDLESMACIPEPLDDGGFNVNAEVPWGCTVEHIRLAMADFLDFLGFINRQLYNRSLARLESLLIPANFSSLVSEFIRTAVPAHCGSIVKNLYHNGHPDLIPAGMFPGDAVQHTEKGIEIKASRYERGWQGHNPEDTWLMVFVFDSNRPIDASKAIKPKPFRFKMVVGVQLNKADWRFSGRSATSRRTITASVVQSGYEKMLRNWIYKAPELVERE